MSFLTATAISFSSNGVELFPRLENATALPTAVLKRLDRAFAAADASIASLCETAKAPIS